MYACVCACVCVCVIPLFFAYRSGPGSGVPHSKVLVQARRRAQVSSSVWINMRFYSHTHVTTRHIAALHVEPSFLGDPKSYIFVEYVDLVTLSIYDAPFISLRIALQTKLAFTHSCMRVSVGNESLAVCHILTTEIHETLWKQ